MDWVSVGFILHCRCRSSIANDKSNDLVLADAVILEELLEVLVIALQALHDMKPLGFRVSSVKFKVQVFGGVQINWISSRSLTVHKLFQRWYELAQHEYKAKFIPVHTDKYLGVLIICACLLILYCFETWKILMRL